MQTVDFDINAFQQYLSVAVIELVKLIGETDTLENKRRVDSTLNTLIEQAGERVCGSLALSPLCTPQASQIIPLPTL